MENGNGNGNARRGKPKDFILFKVPTTWLEFRPVDGAPKPEWYAEVPILRVRIVSQHDPKVFAGEEQVSCLIRYRKGGTWECSAMLPFDQRPQAQPAGAPWKSDTSPPLDDLPF